MDETSKFEQLYEKYSRLMYFIAMKILKNITDAEDAVQQACVALLENLDKVGDIDSGATKGYVSTIVERRAIDIIRSKKKYLLTDDEMVWGLCESPEPQGVVEAMEKLPPQYREVLALRFEYGYSTEEIACFYNMKRGAVQKMLWRAKERLKQGLSA